MYFAMFTGADKFALPNRLAEFYFLYIKDYCILRKMLLTILNQKS